MIKLYYLYGLTELVDAKAQALIDQYMPQDLQAYELMQFNGEPENLGHIQLAIAAAPFLAEKRVVLVRHAEDLVRSKEDSKKALKATEKGFIDFLKTQESDAVVIFTSYEDKAPTGFLKSIAQQGELVSLKKPQGIYFDRWAQEKVKPHQRTLSRDALAWLQYRNHLTSLDTIAQDLHKASLYVPIGQEITAKDLDAVATVAMEESVFKIIDGVISGRPQEALKAWEKGATEHENLYGFLNLLIKNIELILRAQNLKKQGLGLSPIQKRLKGHEYTIKKAYQNAGKLPEDKLRKAYIALANMDLRLKSVGGIQKKEEMADLIIDLAYLFKT